MLYLQTHDVRGREVALVFSTKDSIRELRNFQRLVHAPFYSLHVPDKKGDDDRLHIQLYGKPRTDAMAMLIPAVVFATPIERVIWEAKHPEFRLLHKHPWGLPENPYSETDNA